MTQKEKIERLLFLVEVKGDCSDTALMCQDKPFSEGVGQAHCPLFEDRFCFSPSMTRATITVFEKRIVDEAIRLLIAEVGEEEAKQLLLEVLV